MRHAHVTATTTTPATITRRRPGEVTGKTPPPPAWVKGWAARERRRLGLRGTRAALFDRMATKANGSGVVFVHQARTAAALDVSLATVKRAMAALVAAGAVTQVVAHNKHQAGGWQLTYWPDAWRRLADRAAAADLDLDGSPPLDLDGSPLHPQTPGSEPKTVCDVVSRDVTPSGCDVVAEVIAQPPRWVRDKAAEVRAAGLGWPQGPSGAGYFGRFAR